MLRRIFLPLCLLLCGAPAEASPVVKTKIIGEVQYSRAAASYRLEINQPAGLAVIYDGPQGERKRLLTADGKLTELHNRPPWTTLFDKYVWNEHERALYLLGNSLTRFNPASREFEPVPGGPKLTRDIAYVPRWGAVVLSGGGGLYREGPDGLSPLPSRGFPLKDVTRVIDLPRFRALMLGTIDKALFIRTDDGVLHSVGRLSRRYDTIAKVAELEGSPAVQILGSRDVRHIVMARGSDGVWRPASYRSYSLGVLAPLINDYVPQLDAMVVCKPSWSWLDWWFDRSGLYKLTANGLVPLGDWALRPGTMASLSALYSVSFSVYTPGDPETGKVFYRLERNGHFVRENGLAAVGRYFNVHEIREADQIILRASDGLWQWDGKSSPRRLNEAEWSQAGVLPLTHQLLLHTTDGNMLVDPDGRTTSLGHYDTSGDIFRTYVSQGRVFQAEPDRWFEIGSAIMEVRVAGERNARRPRAAN